MGRRLKTIAIGFSDYLLRGYIRYAPLRAGKQPAWRLYERRFSWRAQPKIAATPFGFRVHVVLPDHIQKVIWLTGRWEPVLTEFVRSRLTPGDTFVDVGANIGYYSLLASRIVGRTGRVYSIEGSPTIFALLQANTALNHVDNVESIHAIAGERDDEQEFWLASTSLGLGRSTCVEVLGRVKGMRSEGRVRCAPLTSIVPTERLLSARIIKVDVEGAERSVLEPLLARLPEFSGRTIWAVELSPEICAGGQADVDRVFNAFCQQGYRGFSIRNDYSLDMYLSKPRAVEMKRITAPPLSQTDVLFLREEALAER